MCAAVDAYASVKAEWKSKRTEEKKAEIVCLFHTMKLVDDNDISYYYDVS